MTVVVLVTIVAPTALVLFEELREAIRRDLEAVRAGR